MDTRRFFFKQLLALPFVGRAVEKAIQEPEPAPIFEPVPEPAPVKPKPRKRRRIINEFGLMLTDGKKEQFLLVDKYALERGIDWLEESSEFARAIASGPVYMTMNTWTTLEHIDEHFLTVSGPIQFNLTTGRIGDRAYRGLCVIDGFSAYDGGVELTLRSVGAYERYIVE